MALDMEGRRLDEWSCDTHIRMKSEEIVIVIPTGRTSGGIWTYAWQAGRKLKQMSKPGTTVQFKYNYNGLRVDKVVNGTETKYQLHGKLIMHMTVGEDNLHFSYDAQSRPAKVSYNGVLYTYVHNLQGDVVGLLY